MNQNKISNRRLERIVADASHALASSSSRSATERERLLANSVRPPACIFVCTMKAVTAALDQNVKVILLAAVLDVVATVLVLVTALVQRRTTRRVKYMVERIDSTVRRVDQILRDERNR